MSQCTTCYLNTGFWHDYPPSQQHKHINGEIVFRYSLKERTSMEIDECIIESQYKYYGPTPYRRPEETTHANQ